MAKACYVSKTSAWRNRFFPSSFAYALFSRKQVACAQVHLDQSWSRPSSKLQGRIKVDGTMRHMEFALVAVPLCSAPD